MNRRPASRPCSTARILSGWYGMASVSPADVAAMTDEERAKKKAADTADALKHWRVENGELVNDGFGAYLTTEKEYGDIELMIDYKTVPKADSGIYLRGTPQSPDLGLHGRGEVRHRRRQGLRRALEQLGRRTRQGPAGAGRQTVWPVESVPHPPDRARTTVYLNGQLVVDNAIMENYWDRKRPLFPQGNIQLQTHGGEIRWRNIFVREIPAEEANKLLQRDDAGIRVRCSTDAT